MPDLNAQIPLKAPIILARQELESLVKMVESPTYSYNLKEGVSPDDWRREVAYFHKWALEIGAWESGRSAVDMKMGRLCEGKFRLFSKDKLIAHGLQRLRDDAQKAQYFVGKIVLKGTGGDTLDADMRDIYWSIEDLIWYLKDESRAGSASKASKEKDEKQSQRA